MDWLAKLQQNSQVFLDNGLIKPQTASKLAQFAEQQKQKVAQAAQLAPNKPMDLNNDNNQKQFEQMGANIGDKLKTMLKTPEQTTPTPSANMMQTEGSFSPEFMTALQNFKFGA